MNKKVVLGIDTSNYMTSICLIDENRSVLFENKKLLEVKQGERGLQQSHAVFQHIKNLPKMLKGIGIDQDHLAAIGVSRAPRPVEGSYMPVFTPGVSLAESIGEISKIPVFYTTHQEGHIAAGLHSVSKQPKNTNFLAVHLSGGTSEILNVNNKGVGFDIEKLGGTLDLHAGQLIDRIGVLMGFSFPSGKELELMAKESSDSFKRIPSTIRELSFHLSGAENEAKKRLSAGEPVTDIARAIEHVIAVSIQKVLRKAIESGYHKELLIVGGVAQNQYIRDYLIKKLESNRVGGELFFADKAYSGDNAFGVANIALNHLVQAFNYKMC